jgi:hypothetical protein
MKALFPIKRAAVFLTNVYKPKVNEYTREWGKER